MGRVKFMAGTNWETMDVERRIYDMLRVLGHWVPR